MSPDEFAAAKAYRAKVRASGDRAEWAAIDGMPDEFVAAVAREDRETMDRVARAEQNGRGHMFGPGFGGSPQGYRPEDDSTLLEPPPPEDAVRRALGDILAWNRRPRALPRRLVENAEAAIAAVTHDPRCSSVATDYDCDCGVTS